MASASISKSPITTINNNQFIPIPPHNTALFTGAQHKNAGRKVSRAKAADGVKKA